MKKIVLFIPVLLLSGLVSFSQDLQCLPSVISTGASPPGSNSDHLSKWMIGEIYQVVLPDPEDMMKDAVIPLNPNDDLSDWKISVFPNPASDLLNIRFEMGNAGDFSYEILDLSGRKMMVKKVVNFLPQQVEKIDISGLVPSMYLLKILALDGQKCELFRFTKMY